MLPAPVRRWSQTTPHGGAPMTALHDAGGPCTDVQVSGWPRRFARPHVWDPGAVRLGQLPAQVAVLAFPSDEGRDGHPAQGMRLGQRVDPEEPLGQLGELEGEDVRAGQGPRSRNRGGRRAAGSGAGRPWCTRPAATRLAWRGAGTSRAKSFGSISACQRRVILRVRLLGWESGCWSGASTRRLSRWRENSAPQLTRNATTAAPTTAPVGASTARPNSTTMAVATASQAGSNARWQGWWPHPARSGGR